MTPLHVAGGQSLCREINTDEDMASLQDAWTRLLADASYPNPFCSWEWAWEWWRYFGKDTSPGFRLIVALAYQPQGTLIGLAPYFYPVAGGALSLRPLRPLGSRSHCSVDSLTEEPLILLHGDHTEEALVGICDALLKWKGRHQWDLIHLRGMRSSTDPDLLSFWRSRRGKAPFLLARPRRYVGQTRTLPGSWPEFRRSLHKSMRDNVAYYPRLLAREGHAFAVRMARSQEEVSQAVLILIDLHTRRALSPRGPKHWNHLPLPVQQRFLHDVLVRLATRGMSAVALLEVNGVPIAAQAVLEYQGMFTLYYSGFDPDWHRYSPITILHVALIQDAIARGLNRMDFLPVAEPWKTRWGTEADFMYDEISCLSLHPRSLLRNAWRAVQPFRAGLNAACDCGYCTREELRSASGTISQENVTGGEPAQALPMGSLGKTALFSDEI